MGRGMNGGESTRTGGRVRCVRWSCQWKSPPWARSSPGWAYVHEMNE
jgi:hypothetical protein